MGRPSHFDINFAHPLARGLVYAGLGNNLAPNRFNDSSIFQKHARKTTAIQWKYNNLLQRYVLDKFSNSTYITVNYDLNLRTECTYGIWIFDYGSSADERFLETSALSLHEYHSDNFPRLEWTNYDTTVGAGRHESFTWRTKRWVYLAAIFKNGLLRTYISYRGLSGQVQLLAGTMISNTLASSTYIRIGKNAVGYFLADPMIWNRALSLSELRMLSKTSDYTLGGLIV